MARIANFLIHNAQKIWAIRDQAGGWEGWLQCELAYLLSTQMQHQGAAVNREMPVFVQQLQRCDIWCDQSPHDHRGPYTAIELKCEGSFNEKAVGDGLGDDIAKLKAGLHPNFRGLTTLLAVAVTFVESDVAHCQGLAETKGLDIYCCRLVTDYFGQSTTSTLSLLWWGGRF